MSEASGFLPGLGLGALVALAAMLLVEPAGTGGTAGAGLIAWIELNLGSSTWLFAAVLAAFVVHLGWLRRVLVHGGEERAVVELDQLTDVWIHLFIGIGVIWTAVGMRSALQLALGDPDEALADTAGSVLQKLVEGGILLALSTTIVGAVGGYLLRLGKTLWVGAALHAHYQSQQHRDVRELVETVRRLEEALPGLGALPVGTFTRRGGSRRDGDGPRSPWDEPGHASG